MAAPDVSGSPTSQPDAAAARKSPLRLSLRGQRPALVDIVLLAFCGWHAAKSLDASSVREAGTSTARNAEDRIRQHGYEEGQLGKVFEVSLASHSIPPRPPVNLLSPARLALRPYYHRARLKTGRYERSGLSSGLLSREVRHRQPSSTAG